MDVRRMVITNRDSSPLCQDCGFCCTVLWLYPSAKELLEGENNPRERHWLESDLVELSLDEAMETGLLVDGLENENPHFYRCGLWDPVTSRCTDYDNRPDPCRRFPYYLIGRKPLKPVYKAGCQLGNFLYSLLSLDPENVELRKNGRGK